VAASRKAPVHTEATRRACPARARNPVDQYQVGGRRLNTLAAGDDQRIQCRPDRRQLIRCDSQSCRGNEVPAALRHDAGRIRRRATRFRNNVVRRRKDLQRAGYIKQLHRRESEYFDHAGSGRQGSWGF
jgi:hypothetical protein